MKTSVRLFEGIGYIDPAFVEEAGEPLERRAPVLLKPLRVLAASFAAAFILLFAANAVSPAFAESLPLIGEVFRQLNSLGANAPTYEGVIETVGTGGENQEYRAAVTEAYCDGEYLFFALRLEPKTARLLKMETLYTEENTGESDAPGWQVSFNGESGGLIYGLPRFTRKGSYFESSPLQVRIPDRREPDAPIHVEAVIGNLFGDGQALSLEPVVLDFDVSPNTGYNRQEQADAAIDGLTLKGWSLSPSKLSVSLSYPYFGPGGVTARAWTENGTDLGYDIREQGDLADRGYRPGDTAEQECGFTGPAQDARQVTVAVLSGRWEDEPAVFGVFTIDLESGEVTAAESCGGLPHASVREYAKKAPAETENPPRPSPKSF